jgi:hypothetical protein
MPHPLYNLPVLNNTVDKAPEGELAVLETGGQYGINSLKYPAEVGTDEAPHYIVFNIYVPDNDTYAIKTYGTTNANSRSQQNSDFLKSKRPQNGQFTQLGIGATSVISGVKAAAEDGVWACAGAVLGTEAAGQAVSQVAKQVSFRPKIKQIKKSVAIYMPDTIMSTMKHDHTAMPATEALGTLGLASAIGGSMAAALEKNWETFKSGNQNMESLFKQTNQTLSDIAKSPGGQELLGTIGQGTKLVGPGFTDLVLKSSGISVNPQVELLYKGTANRSFVFEFRFQPRSKQEAQTIKEIIQTFKIFSSPSIQPGSRGRYFMVPGQFDITFKFGNATNEYISKISTCVLNSVDINYSGAGQWATFEDGAPVEIQMQLVFTEGEIITRELLTAKGGF